MMPTSVLVKGQPVRLTADKVVGEGGEAVVYKLDPQTVLKLYKEPNDASYADNADARQGARQRLVEQQQKLPAFPKHLPGHVVAPQELAYDRQQPARITGFTMPFLDDMEVLLSYGKRAYREALNIDANQMVAIFRDLYRLVQGVHGVGVVIGDFNDLNVLVNRKNETYLVDADSMQFGRFLCYAYTKRFVDPLLCEPDELKLYLPHNPNSDWYAFATMLFEKLLYLNPYFGGVHKPKTGKAMRNDARVLKRLSVLSPEVTVPKNAIPTANLPDELLQYFNDLYCQDKRGTFPEQLLLDLRWTTCSSCGLVHARSRCPACAAPGIVKQTLTVRGNVVAARLFKTNGRILFATHQGGELRYVYHENNRYRREDGREILQGALDGELRLRIQGANTLLAKGSNLVTLAPDGTRNREETDQVGRLPVFDANERHTYRITGDRLVHDGRFAPVDIGEILPHQTLVWAGRRFGFGFYRAGALTRGFVFDSERPGINDAVPLPVLDGQLIDATCVFSDQLAWFMLSMQSAGVLKNYCFVINDRAQLVARMEAAQGDGSWLADGIRGRLAQGQALYAATDAGIVRIGLNGTDLATERTFPDTEPFVTAATQLLPGKNGLTAVSSQAITQLEIK